MANIERSDGTIVSWGGDVVGPECVLNEMGRPTGWNKFKTECAIDGEIHEVSFVILDFESTSSALCRLGNEMNVYGIVSHNISRSSCGTIVKKLPSARSSSL